MKKIILDITLLLLTAAVQATTIRVYKRPVNFPVQFNIEHTYVCIDGTSNCYGYNVDSAIHTTGSVVQGGSFYMYANTSKAAICTTNLMFLNMGWYWSDGVCHQHSNRGLYWTGQQLGSGVVGYTTSLFFYGVYGKTWPFYSSAPYCTATASSAALVQTTLEDDSVSSFHLDGPITQDNQELRNSYYAKKRMEMHLRSAQRGEPTDHASAISREFSYRIYEMLGADYDKKKTAHIRKIHRIFLVKDDVLSAQLKAAEISEEEFHQKRNSLYSAILYQLFEILGPGDFELLFEIRSENINNAWHDFVKELSGNE